jgi:hypothetical protein
MLDHDRFEKIASGIQSVVTTIGIVVAGWWAYHTFGSVGSVQKADLEIATLKQTAARQPVLQIDIQATPAASASAMPTQRRLQVAVKLKNDGNTSLMFSPPELEVAAISISIQGKEPVPNWQRYNAKWINADGGFDAMPERLLGAGQTRTVAFLVEVPARGTYLLQVTSSYSAGEFREGHAVHGVIRDAALVPCDEASGAAGSAVIAPPPCSGLAIAAVEQLAVVVP